MADMGQIVLHGHTFTQLGPALRRELSLPQFLEQAFIGMNRHTPPMGARGTLCPQGAGGTSGGWKVYDPAQLERRFDVVWTAQRLALPGVKAVLAKCGPCRTGHALQ